MLLQCMCYDVMIDMQASKDKLKCRSIPPCKTALIALAVCLPWKKKAQNAAQQQEVLLMSDCLLSGLLAS